MAKRKMSENSLANLKLANPENNFNNSEIARKAQEKSVESRKANKTFQDIINLRLENIDEESGLTNKVAIADAMITKAKQGDKAAAEFVRDTAGEKPSDSKIISGSLDIQKIFITPEEHDATIKHIEDVINDKS